MTYPVGARNQGWLWEHRFKVIAVCLGVIAVEAVPLSLGLAPFPLWLLLAVADIVSLLVLAALLLLWLSKTASNLPRGTEPAI